MILFERYEQEDATSTHGLEEDSISNFCGNLLADGQVALALIEVQIKTHEPKLVNPSIRSNA